MKIIFIGGGNIAEAIFAKLNSTGITVIQRNLQKLERLKTQYPKITFSNILDFETNENDLVFLCVKPQDAHVTCQNISQLVKSSTIISVMAGISVQKLGDWLKNSHICRIMPNTPSTLGVGVCGTYFTSSINKQTQDIILEILAKTGKVYKLSTEDQIDQITAIGASSPAYIYYFIEALIKAALQFDFDADIIRDITLQVIKGSLSMIEHNSDISIEQLRLNVTSKNGTTEQANNVLKEYNLIQIINEAEKACYNRAKEISKLFDSK